MNQEGIDFKVSDKSSRTSSRAPLSAYVEVDIMVLSSDLVRTARLLDLPAD